jgi:hypothetical protein
MTTSWNGSCVNFSFGANVVSSPLRSHIQIEPVSVAVTLLTRFRQALYSNFALNTDYPEAFHSFPQSFQEGDRILPRLSHNRFLPKTSWIIIICHLTVRLHIVQLLRTSFSNPPPKLHTLNLLLKNYFLNVRFLTWCRRSLFFYFKSYLFSMYKLSAR